MKTCDIEPGGIYVGKTGLPREFVRWSSLGHHLIYYRVVSPRRKGPLTLANVYRFAAWAIEETSR